VTVSNSMRALCLLAALAMAISCGQSKAAPDGEQVPARLFRDHPCPSVAPPNWTAADQSLGRGPRCVLVATAASAVMAAAAHDTGIARVRLERANCVRLERVTLRTGARDSIVSDGWLVVFYSDRQPDVAVAIHAATGEAGAFISPRDDGSTIAQKCAPAT
jgi:DNA-binding transcriptional LysR family regulator